MNNPKLLALYPLLFSCVAMATDINENNMDKIVVTASGSERSTLLAPASLSVITREELERVSDQKLVSAIRKTAGVSVAGTGVGGRKVIQLRGMESKHSLILIDGKRVSATDDVVGHSDLQYDWLPLDSIERIEIIRGPMSSLYGSEALGGVINIITRNNKVEAQRNVMLGSSIYDDDDGGEQYYGNVQFKQPLSDNLLITGHFGHQYQDDVLSDEDSRISSLEGRKVDSVKLGADWTVNENNRFQLDYFRTDEERWQQTNYRGSDPYHRSWYDLDREQFSIYWQPKLGAWTGNVGYYRSKIDVVHNTNESSVDAYTPQYLQDDVAEARFYRDFGSSRLTIGGEYRDEELEHEAFVGGGDNAIHKSGLLQYEKDLLDNVFLTLGGRWDHHEYFGGEFSPRAYLVWEAMPGLAIKTGYGHGFKAPTLKQISPNYRFDGPHSFVGNENLNPETSDTWELGLRYEAGMSEFSATIFKNDVEDLITTECINNCGMFFGREHQYVNVDEAEIKGLEMEASHPLTDSLTLTGSYTYTKGEDKTTGEKLTARPRHQGTLGMNIDWIPNTLSSSIDWQYIGKQWISLDSELEELPSYSLVNANLSYLLGKHRFVLSATNIGNTDLLEKSESFGYAEYARAVKLNWYWQF
ncbi:TonB-dependent receptor plug domain-containing protein [Methylophaga nitratireducenticrescens]|uniref:TonB-dependent receptor n=1 Tax=Methylophaga nitratireducenticrescens TaxID=754476 RepID=I1XH26_METNJ|nr:TonB-dependent receptor [Methylophaga nitratireducenticrescens]